MNIKTRKIKLPHLGGYIRFRERMLLIYIIGGIIPFIMAVLYIMQSSRASIIEQNKKAQAEEITSICDAIRESMDVAEDVAVQIYSDDTVKKITSKVAKKNYKSARTFDEDCKDLKFIDNYTHYYGDEISNIKIYVANETISSNRYFSYISEEDADTQRWYVPTCEKKGKNYWAYSYDETNKKALQLSRSILDDNGEVIGVLAIQLAGKKTIERITGRDVNTALFYKENDIIAINFLTDKAYRSIFKELWDLRGVKGTETISYEIKEYLVTYERIYLNHTGIYFMVTSIQDYDGLLTEIDKSSLVSMITVVIGLVISVLLTMIFSAMFGNRISLLRKQMHYVALGEYDKVEPITGRDEVAQLYQELEQMMTDIKNLTSRVTEEQVQKEKLHTKQKEVEFKMLASQINPHFLYNTLETIRMKAKINRQPEIEELVKMLAKIMRRNIQVSDRMVTLASEIELIQNYLVIQNYRFGDHIRSEVIVDESVDTQIQVVPLIMQPFVENAYVHGLEAKGDDGLLQIHVMQEDGIITIEIRDDGVGMSYYKLALIRKSLHDAKPFEKGHIGVNNVNQRLRILYGEEYGVQIESVEYGGTMVTIRFPVQNVSTEQDS